MKIPLIPIHWLGMISTNKLRKRDCNPLWREEKVERSLDLVRVRLRDHIQVPTSRRLERRISWWWFITVAFKERRRWVWGKNKEFYVLILKSKDVGIEFIPYVYMYLLFSFYLVSHFLTSWYVSVCYITSIDYKLVIIWVSFLKPLACSFCFIQLFSNAYYCSLGSYVPVPTFFYVVLFWC